MNEPNNLCKQHTGVVARITHLEETVNNLWKKWDSMQKTVVGIFATLSLNLIVVVLLLIKAFKTG